MPEGRPALPSMITLSIGDPALVAGIDAAIGEAVDDEQGAVLTWLGGDSYLLCRAAAKRLGVGRSAGEVDAWLLAIDGVTGVRRLTADQAGEAYLTRPAGRPPAAPAAPQDDWNLAMVRARAAWAMLPGGLPGGAWKGVRLGHIDTGYTEHRVFGPWQDHRSPSLRPAAGINYVETGPGKTPRDPLDYSGQPGHGTRTASVLAGYEPGRFLGIAPQATVVPYRLTNSVVINAFGNDVQLDEALRHALYDAGCRVISISLGDPCASPKRVGRRIDQAYEAGVIVVAAAGNITSEVTYLGRYARTICAGGVTRDWLPWTGGARGRWVDVSAPAEGVFRATAALDNGRPSYGYGGGGDGTSYATVHVSGAALLWLAYHGGALARYDDGWQLVEAFRRLVRRTARKPGGWPDSLFGAGVLDIAELLAAELPDPASLNKQEIKAADEVV